MADGHGGARTPRNPAPVSGPGRLSKRTDGQTTVPMTGMAYGENADFNEIQSSAPMAAAPSMRAGAVEASAPRAEATPLFAPTARPDEPITAGAPFGPGDMPQQGPNLSQMSREEAQILVDSLPVLEAAANSEYGTDSFRRFVRYVRSVV